jgi:outer membrane biogenesis lipoprotein LolB
MRTALAALLLLTACSKADDKPAGNEQAVIDKANADVIAAEAEAAR